MKILVILLMLSASASAMDRWTALAMLESGGNDQIIGQAGEVSRYQIRRELWLGGKPSDASVALENAQRIWPNLNALMAGHQMILNFIFFGMHPRKSIIHTLLWSNAPGDL